MAQSFGPLNQSASSLSVTVPGSCSVTPGRMSQDEHEPTGPDAFLTHHLLQVWTRIAEHEKKKLPFL